MDQIEQQALARMARTAGRSGHPDEAGAGTREAPAFRQESVGQPKRGLQFLPHARDRLHRADLDPESDHGLVSRIGPPSLRSPQTAELHVCELSIRLLQYNQTQQDFYGGNFWDLRATGYRLQNPAAEQAQGPPVDPNEMGFADTACVVHRLSQSAYRPLFEAVWGEQAFAIQWPADIEPDVQQAGSRSRERSVSRASGQGGPRPLELHVRSVCAVGCQLRSVAGRQPVFVEIRLRAGEPRTNGY